MIATMTRMWVDKVSTSNSWNGEHLRMQSATGAFALWLARRTNFNKS
jgi:hypothetical protein